jgi:hypothetical protein
MIRPPSSLPTRSLAAALAALLLGATPASAASPVVTRQAAAADASFLDYAPPPPGGAGALCLVDTGVSLNADTAPGLVAATALDGGTGSDVDPLAHGTIDAAAAGGSGQGGLLGAWPQLKIVSVRSTDVPSPGTEPSFAFNDYVRGIDRCTSPLPAGSPRVLAIDLPLSSVIQPSPDQTAAFADAVAKAQAQGITILAAAGNHPGPIELPASEPGIFAVGAGDTTNGGICSISATTSLTFYAPGCVLDTIDPLADTPLCCGNGTSQASAYAAGVLVALRGYDPALTPAAATQLLLSTTTDGHLDVAAAFRAAGLSAIVDAGNAATPKPVPTTSSAMTPAAAPISTSPSGHAPVPTPSVKSLKWRGGVLRIALRSLPRGARLHVEIEFASGKPLYVVTSHPSLHRRVRRPLRALLHLAEEGAPGATVSINV